MVIILIKYLVIINERRNEVRVGFDENEIVLIKSRRDFDLEEKN